VQVVPTQRVFGLDQVLQEGLDLLQRRPAEPRVLERGRVQRVDAVARGKVEGHEAGGQYLQAYRKLDSKRSNYDMIRVSIKKKLFCNRIEFLLFSFLLFS
jgi:hypothetical protein